MIQIVFRQILAAMLISSMLITSAFADIADHCGQMKESLKALQTISNNYERQGKTRAELEAEFDEISAKLTLIDMAKRVKDNFVAFLSQESRAGGLHGRMQSTLTSDSYNLPLRYAETGLNATANMAALSTVIEGVVGGGDVFSSLSDPTADSTPVCIGGMNRDNQGHWRTTPATSCNDDEKVDPFVARLMEDCRTRYPTLSHQTSDLSGGSRVGSRVAYANWDSGQELCFRLTSVNPAEGDAGNSLENIYVMRRLISTFATAYRQAAGVQRYASLSESQRDPEELARKVTEAKALLRTLGGYLTDSELGGLEGFSEDTLVLMDEGEVDFDLGFNRGDIDNATDETGGVLGVTNHMLDDVGFNAIVQQQPDRREVYENMVAIGQDMETCLLRAAVPGTEGHDQIPPFATESLAATYSNPTPEDCERLWQGADGNSGHRQLMDRAVGGYQSTFDGIESNPLLSLAMHRHEAEITAGDFTTSVHEAAAQYISCYQSEALRRRPAPGAATPTTPLAGTCPEIDIIEGITTSSGDVIAHDGVAYYDHVISSFIHETSEMGNVDLADNPFFTESETNADAFEEIFKSAMIGSRNLARIHQGIRSSENLSDVRGELSFAGDYDEPEDYYIDMLDRLYNKIDGFNCIEGQSRAEARDAIRTLKSRRSSGNDNDQEVRRLFHACARSMVDNQSDASRTLAREKTALLERYTRVHQQLGALEGEEGFGDLATLQQRLGLLAAHFCNGDANTSIQRVQCSIPNSRYNNGTEYGPNEIDLLLSGTGEIIASLPDTMYESVEHSPRGMATAIGPACATPGIGSSTQRASDIRGALGPLCSAFPQTTVAAGPQNPGDGRPAEDTDPNPVPVPAPVPAPAPAPAPAQPRPTPAPGALGSSVPYMSEMEKADRRRAAFHQQFTPNFNMVYDTRKYTILHYEDRTSGFERSMYQKLASSGGDLLATWMYSDMRRMGFESYARGLDGYIGFLNAGGTQAINNFGSPLGGSYIYSQTFSFPGGGL